MATQNPPAYIQAGSHGAAVFRQALSSIWHATQPGTLAYGAGGVTNYGDLTVTQNGTPNMSVNVAAGSCWIPQTNAANGGLYFCLNDATVNTAVSTANATNPRIDMVVATVADAAYSGGSNAWSISVIAGTATAGATLINLNGAPAVPASSIPLAYLLVPASTSSIITADIGNIARVMTAMQQNPAGRLYPAATTAVGTSLTAITLANSTFLRGGMTQSGNTLIVPTSGYYQIQGQTILSTTSGVVATAIYVNGASVAAGQTGFNSVSGAGSLVSDIQYVAAGQAIALYALQTAGGTVNNSYLTTQTWLSASLVSQ